MRWTVNYYATVGMPWSDSKVVLLGVLEGVGMVGLVWRLMRCVCSCCVVVVVCYICVSWCLCVCGFSGVCTDNVIK